MNPLSLLVLQNKCFDTKVNLQAQQIFELISKAIISDKEYVDFFDYIYPVNRTVLQNKGYLVADNKIIWSSYCPVGL